VFLEQPQVVKSVAALMGPVYSKQLERQKSSVPPHFQRLVHFDEEQVPPETVVEEQSASVVQALEQERW